MEALLREKEASSTLTFRVEESTYVTGQQFLYGKELKRVAGIPPEEKLYLQNSAPWVDNLIDDNEEVDLARPGIEYFFVEKNFKFIVNSTTYSWRQRYIIGQQIRQIAKIGEKDQLLLKTNDSRIDQFIQDQDKIDLLQPGIEQFYSKLTETQITIIVSGTPKSWNKAKISFKEVIELAYGTYMDNPATVYTVAYEDGPKQNHEGSMVKGSEVFTKEKMIFHATATNQS